MLNHYQNRLNKNNTQKKKKKQDLDYFLLLATVIFKKETPIHRVFDPDCITDRYDAEPELDQATSVLLLP